MVDYNSPRKEILTGWNPILKQMPREKINFERKPSLTHP